LVKNEKYYVRGNTAEGLVNYSTSNLHGIEKVIVLEHPSETLKTAILNQLIRKFEEHYQIEILLSPNGYDYLDGLIMRGKSIAVINNAVQNEDTPKVETFDLSKYVAHSLLTDDFIEAKNIFQHEQQSAYSNFATGLHVHDDLEAIYIAEMNFEKAEQLADTFISNLLNDDQKTEQTAHEYHRFFGTNTVDGVVNEIPHLKEKLSNVYYIKGRAGTGKSTFIKKIGMSCKQHGFDIEYYHCSFDPGSIDMLIVRDLDFCMFDSTDPHEFFPDRDTDIIVDLYEEAVTPGTDERYANEINQINAHYKSYMKTGLKHLKAAGKCLEIMEKHYTVDEMQLNKITEDVARQIRL